MATSITARAPGARVRRGLWVFFGPREFPVTVGFLTTLIGAVVLTGWWLGIDQLKSIVPGVVTMKVNTAIGFVLLGSGLMVRARGSRWATILLIGTMALAGIVGSQYLIVGDLGIDQWLFHEAPGQVGTVQPNRMAPMTVACFLLIAGAIALESRDRWRRVSVALVMAAVAVAFFNILEALFHPSAPTLLADDTQMAAVTATAFILASVGLCSLLSLDGEFVGFTGNEVSARHARRLLGAAIVAPTLMTTLWLRGQEVGLYEARYGASLVVIGTIAFLAAIIHNSARANQRSEAARERVREERDRFFDVSLDMLATADDRGYFIRLNPAWTTTLGYELDELTARPFVDFVHPEDREATSAEAARQIERGQTVLNFQNRYRHRDGSYRWLEWASTPSADGSRLYAMARDITARKAEEDRLAALAAPAREREARRVAAHALIEEVIAARAFSPVYQPIVDLASRGVVGFEALTRFDGGRRPDEMFAQALDCGLGTTLEAATLEASLAQAAELPRRAWLSLNVSPAMIELDGVLEGLLQRTERPVVLEITEHEAVTEYGALRDAVLRLGPRIRLAVDDTGAGVANFNHLVELRADFIKIDVGLVRGVEHDVGRQAVVAGLVHFAASAGCQVIAEGIETEAEQATVTGLGVTLGQGYLLARPAPVAMWRDSSIVRLAPVLPLRPTPGKDGRRTSLVS